MTKNFKLEEDALTAAQALRELDNSVREKQEELQKRASEEFEAFTEGLDERRIALWKQLTEALGIPEEGSYSLDFDYAEHGCVFLYEADLPQGNSLGALMEKVISGAQEH